MELREQILNPNSNPSMINRQAELWDKLKPTIIQTSSSLTVATRHQVKIPVHLSNPSEMTGNPALVT